MPRRSSGRPRPPAAHSPLRNPPKPQPEPAVHAPPPATLQSGNRPVTAGIGAAVADGLAFGSGSAVAHRAVDAVMGPRVIHHETVASSAPAAAPNTNSLRGADACGGQFKALQDDSLVISSIIPSGVKYFRDYSVLCRCALSACLNNYGSDISKCQFYMDMLQECRKGSVAGLGA